MAVSPAELGIPRRITQMEERLPGAAQAAHTMEMAWKIAGVPEDDIVRMREDLLTRAVDPSVRTDRVQPAVDIADKLAPYLPFLEYQIINRENPTALKQPDTSKRDSVSPETSPKRVSFDQQQGEQIVWRKEMTQQQEISASDEKQNETPKPAINHWSNKRHELQGRVKGRRGPGKHSGRSI